MKHGVMLLLLGVAQVYLALQAGRLIAPLLWSGVSFGIVGVGYVVAGPRVFAKRTDGSIPWWTAALLLPYLAVTWALWYAWRLLSREPACAQVVPGLWIGRLPLKGELPPGVTLVVDMTCEFPAARAARTGCTYRCLPTLDGTAPDPEAFRELVELIARWQGGVYIHCAQGHGRSALVVVAVLLAKGTASSVTDAEATLRAARPLVRLAPAQRRLLEQATWLVAGGAT